MIFIGIPLNKRKKLHHITPIGAEIIQMELKGFLECDHKIKV